MSHITLGFSHHANSIISRIMAWLPWQRYTHVILVSPDGTMAIEASGYGKPSGVRVVDMARFREEGGVLKRIPHPDPWGVWRAAEGKIGAEYDWAFVFGWLFRMNIQKPEKFVCHELILWAAEQTEKPLFRMDQAWKTTPQHLYLISEDFDA